MGFSRRPFPTPSRSSGLSTCSLGGVDGQLATRPLIAIEELGKAVDAYRKGLQVDLPDLYHGINLMSYFA